MKKYLLIPLLIFPSLSTNLFSQDKDIWKAYEDVSTGLYGFKDNDGNIKIQPKYVGFMIADKFSDIIAVMEEDNSSYYITKSGHKVGKDSVYISDNSFDCEYEGYIRFRDPMTQKVGIFNSEGKVVIPAEYEVLSKMINGMAVALKDAKKYSHHNDSTDEHWIWSGGKQFLIDSSNKILIEDFPNDFCLDFHSLKIEDYPSKDINRGSFLSTNGKYYTFINNEKLFNNWFHNDFLKHLSKEKISGNCYPILIYWTDENGWDSKNSKEFIDYNYDLINSKFYPLDNGNTDYFFTLENNLITTNDVINEFDKYLDDCGQFKSTQYPIFNIVINHRDTNDFHQDNFTFFETDNGFKLINISIPNSHLK